MKSNEHISVVYASDDNYSVVAGVSIFSLLQNNQNYYIDVYLLNDNIGEENLRRIKHTFEQFKYAKLYLVEIQKQIEFLKKNGVVGYGAAENLNLTAYSRLFLSELLPQTVERIIYLDCDTLVNKDILGLWEASLSGKAMCMAYDCLQNRYKKYIGLDERKAYFNSGVMLIDLKKWKENRCFERIMEHLQNVRNNYPLVDQDFINVVLKDDISLLDIRYNFLSQYFLYDYVDLCTVYDMEVDYFWQKNEWIIDKINEPVIFHFCGNTFIRPWYKNSKHPIKKKYNQYYQKSEWRDALQKKYKLPVQYRIQYFLYRYMPRRVSTKLGQVMQLLFMKKEYHV